MKILIILLNLFLISCSSTTNEVLKKESSEQTIDSLISVNEESSTEAPTEYNLKASSQIRSNLMTPYYQFQYDIRQICKIPSQEPTTSLFQDAIDSKILDKINPILSADKSNYKLFYTELKNLNCNLNKEDFLSLMKKYKCFMFQMQNSCESYNKNKNILSSQSTSSEDAFFIKRLSSWTFCDKDFGKSLRSEKWCIEYDSVDFN